MKNADNFKAYHVPSARPPMQASRVKHVTEKETVHVACA